MSRLRTEISSALIRMFVKRRSWGPDETALARRARRVFGTPNALLWLYSRGVSIRTVRESSVTGEWLEPDQQGDEPLTMLYIHGGGFVSCTARTHRPITTTLARAGVRVFAVEYRRAPEHRFPYALNDVVAAYRWLVSGGTLAHTISIAGDSAGGGLVLSTLVSLRDAGDPLPACGVMLSPWTDLAGTGKTITSNEKRCAMFFAPNIRDFARAYVGEESPLHPLASPLYADLKGLPPVLLQVGEPELLRDDAVGVHDRITALGGQSTLEIWQDVPHVWHMLAGILPESNQALQGIVRFVREQVKRGARQP